MTLPSQSLQSVAGSISLLQPLTQNWFRLVAEVFSTQKALLQALYSLFIPRQKNVCSSVTLVQYLFDSLCNVKSYLSEKTAMTVPWSVLSEIREGICTSFVFYVTIIKEVTSVETQHNVYSLTNKLNVTVRHTSCFSHEHNNEEMWHKNSPEKYHSASESITLTSTHKHTHTLSYSCTPTWAHTQTLIHSDRQREEQSVYWFLDEHRSHAQLIVLWGVAAPIIIQLQVEINTEEEGETKEKNKIKHCFSFREE